MRIGNVESGSMGGTLGKKWAKAGHKVVFGVGDVHSPRVPNFWEALEGD